MSGLFLVHDFSPLNVWLAVAFHAARGFLGEHGLEFWRLPPWSGAQLPHHNHFWSPASPLSPLLEKEWQALAAALDAGRNIILLRRFPSPEGCRRFGDHARAFIDSAHSIRSLFILGEPPALLEQRFRTQPSEASIQASLHMDGYRVQADEIDAARGFSEEPALLANPGGSPVSGPDEELARRVFAFLGCPMPALPGHLPCHPLFLGSVTGRRLATAAEVRHNAWPPLDEAQYMEALLPLDRTWDTAPVSPRHVRRELAEREPAERARLEALLGLEAGALAPPAWLLEEEAVAADAPLEPECVRAFATALNAGNRKALRRRFAQDAPLLTDDQKLLDAALCEGGHCARLGEPEPPVELTVLTMTFNQEKYIGECMDSVLAQKTSFPVRHLVLDHHSSDATPAIIAEYASRHPSVRPILLSLHLAWENVLGLFLRARTKYVALCDGDDYFSDPLKLEKQVAFLENRPHCALCFHPVAVVFENGEPARLFPSPGMLPRGIREEYYLADLLRANIIQTNSAVYRWRFREGLPPWFRADVCPADWYWHLLHAEMGKVGYINEIMAVYRRHGAALYMNAFHNMKEHMRVHGMTELAAYSAYDDHFGGRYFRVLVNPANAVLAAFFEIATTEGDGRLFQQACAQFPKFAANFLQEYRNRMRASGSGGAPGQTTPDIPAADGGAGRGGSA